MCLKCYTVTGTIKAVNFCNLLFKVKSWNELANLQGAIKMKQKLIKKTLRGKYQNLQVGHTIEKETQALFLHLLYKIEKIEKF